MSPKYTNKQTNNKGVAWLYSEVCALLEVWADHDIQQQLAGRLHNMCVYDKISKRLLSLGIDRTGEQCREKIKKLKRDYKIVVENNYAPAFARKLLGCYDKVHEVFGKCAVVKPSSVIESLLLVDAQSNNNTSASSEIKKLTSQRGENSAGASNDLATNLNVHDLDTDFSVHDLTTDLSVHDLATDLSVPDLPTDLSVHDVATNLSVHDLATDLSIHDVPTNLNIHDVTTNLSVHDFATNLSVHSSHYDSDTESGGDYEENNDTLSKMQNALQYHKQTRRKKHPQSPIFVALAKSQESLRQRYLKLEKRRLKREMDMERNRLLLAEKRRQQERQQEYRLFKSFLSLVANKHRNSVLRLNGEDVMPNHIITHAGRD